MWWNTVYRSIPHKITLSQIQSNGEISGCPIFGQTPKTQRPQLRDSGSRFGGGPTHGVSPWYRVCPLLWVKRIKTEVTGRPQDTDRLGDFFICGFFDTTQAHLEKPFQSTCHAMHSASFVLPRQLQDPLQDGLWNNKYHHGSNNDNSDYNNDNSGNNHIGWRRSVGVSLGLLVVILVHHLVLPSLQHMPSPWLSAGSTNTVSLCLVE